MHWSSVRLSTNNEAGACESGVWGPCADVSSESSSLTSTANAQESRSWS
jgi:hypothetical protein